MKQLSEAKKADCPCEPPNLDNLRSYIQDAFSGSGVDREKIIIENLDRGVYVDFLMEMEITHLTKELSARFTELMRDDPTGVYSDEKFVKLCLMLGTATSIAQTVRKNPFPRKQ